MIDNYQRYEKKLVMIRISIGLRNCLTRLHKSKCIKKFIRERNEKPRFYATVRQCSIYS